MALDLQHGSHCSSGELLSKADSSEEVVCTCPVESLLTVLARQPSTAAHTTSTTSGQG